MANVVRYLFMYFSATCKSSSVKCPLVSFSSFLIKLFAFSLSFEISIYILDTSSLLDAWLATSALSEEWDKVKLNHQKIKQKALTCCICTFVWGKGEKGERTGRGGRHLAVYGTWVMVPTFHSTAYTSSSDAEWKPERRVRKMSAGLDVKVAHQLNAIDL